VSKRSFKKAVDRNRIKRLGREAYRLQQNLLSEGLPSGSDSLNLFFVYSGKQLPDYVTAYRQVGLIIQKLVMKIHENAAANT
jgi:ribonuclease P protein component